MVVLQHDGITVTDMYPIVKNLLCKEKEEYVSNIHTQEVLENRSFWGLTSLTSMFTSTVAWEDTVTGPGTILDVFLYPSRFVI